MLDRGANTSTADDDRNTPLHYAAEKGWTSIVEKLIKHRSRLLAKNKDSLIPLEVAIKKIKVSLLLYL